MLGDVIAGNAERMFLLYRSLRSANLGANDYIKLTLEDAADELADRAEIERVVLGGQEVDAKLLVMLPIDAKKGTEVRYYMHPQGTLWVKSSKRREIRLFESPLDAGYILIKNGCEDEDGKIPITKRNENGFTPKKRYVEYVDGIRSIADKEWKLYLAEIAEQGSLDVQAVTQQFHANMDLLAARLAGFGIGANTFHSTVHYSMVGPDMVLTHYREMDPFDSASLNSEPS
ncbi:MAG: hypothetical protein ABIE94_00790 [archaeon]